MKSEIIYLIQASDSNDMLTDDNLSFIESGYNLDSSYYGVTPMSTRTFDAERIKTNGIYLNVIQGGPEDGPLVILLHGFPDFWFGWRKQIGYLSDLGLRVWVPDQRGYNLSDKPKGVNQYQVHNLVDDVIGLIDAAGEEQAMLVGHDWGAMVAWWAALYHPERVSKLSILNVPHPKIFYETALSSFEQLRKSWYVGFFLLPGVPERAFKQFNSNIVLNRLQSDALDGSFSDDELEWYRTAWQRPNALNSMLNWYRAYVWQQPEDPVSWQVTVPTTMIWGENDDYLSAAMAQPSIDLCDEGQLYMIPDATHWVQRDAKDQVNQLLGNFLT